MLGPMPSYGTELGRTLIDAVPYLKSTPAK